MTLSDGISKYQNRSKAGSIDINIDETDEMTAEADIMCLHSADQHEPDSDGSDTFLTSI